MTQGANRPKTMAPTPRNRRYSELRIETWEEARGELAKFPGTWMFRGQENSDWLLTTSLERVKGARLSRYHTEGFIWAEFKKQAHHYLSGHLLPTNSLEWLALMQHHGAPTRLLDWTFSRYVACFFALEDSEEDSAVWAIDYIWCRHWALENILKGLPQLKLVADGWDSF